MVITTEKNRQREGRGGETTQGGHRYTGTIIVHDRIPRLLRRSLPHNVELREHPTLRWKSKYQRGAVETVAISLE